MVSYDGKAPGVYIKELQSGDRPIQAVGTSNAGFLGVAPKAEESVLKPFPINNWTQFKKKFCNDGTGASTDLARAVYGFFQNGGSRCYVVNLGNEGSLESGLNELARIDDVAIVAAPGYTSQEDYQALIEHCKKEDLKDRVAILDAPGHLKDNEIDQLKVVGSNLAPSFFTVPAEGSVTHLPEYVSSAVKNGDHLKLDGTGKENETVKVLDARQNEIATTKVGNDGKWTLTISLPKEGERRCIVKYDGLKPPPSSYAAFYFPWIQVRDPLLPRDHPDTLRYTPPSGHIAGIWARSDASRGVHKAPANEQIHGALGITVRLTDTEQGGLNKAGINCIRLFAHEGILVWGARTLEPDGLWCYLNVRRLFNMIEESIKESTRWIVFEPNDETLWKAIRRDVTAFLTRIWRTGALMGNTADKAFFVKCDAETNPPEEINKGIVTILIGIAPVKPAEFVIFQISQLPAGTEIAEIGG
jgi:uncharacterized protein